MTRGEAAKATARVIEDMLLTMSDGLGEDASTLVRSLESRLQRQGEALVKLKKVCDEARDQNLLHFGGVATRTVLEGSTQEAARVRADLQALTASVRAIATSERQKPAVATMVTGDEGAEWEEEGAGEYEEAGDMVDDAAAVSSVGTAVLPPMNDDNNRAGLNASVDSDDSTDPDKMLL